MKKNHYARIQKDLSDAAATNLEEVKKMKRVTLDIEPSVHNTLKVFATLRHMSIKKYIMEVLVVKMLLDEKEFLGK